MAVAGRFINSNLKVASDNTDATSSFAVDVLQGGFFQSEELASVNLTVDVQVSISKT
jgi:hypothetical protein